MVKQSIKQLSRQDVRVIVIEESNREYNPGMLLSAPLSQTYHIHLSPIINILIPELFEFS